MSVNILQLYQELSEAGLTTVTNIVDNWTGSQTEAGSNTYYLKDSQYVRLTWSSSPSGGDDTTASTAIAAHSAANLSGLAAANYQPNILINGGFDFWQRQDPPTLTTRSDDTYGPDRWVILTQSNSIQCQQPTAGNGFTAYARYACLLKQTNATAQRMGILQIVENANSRVFRIGRVVGFQIKARCSSTRNIRYALLEWQGTGDVVTSDVVSSWPSTTYTEGNFFISSCKAVAVGSASVGTTYTQLSCNGFVTNSCNNLIVVVWTEGTAAQNETLEVTEAGLYEGSFVTPVWSPRPIQQELALCERYFEKIGGEDAAWPIMIGYGTGGNNADADISFKVDKRVIPTMTKTGSWTVTNANQPTFGSPTTKGCRRYITVTSTGYIDCYPGSTSNYVTADAEL